MASNTEYGKSQDASRDHAARFGEIIRERRKELKLRQDDVALASGLGRRFIVDLEAGKPSCHLGKALLVATTLGLDLLDKAQRSPSEDNALLPDLLDSPDDHA
ncbi:MAG: helix-turn-helix domain-containing protein [Pseudomonadota bacterium]